MKARKRQTFDQILMRASTRNAQLLMERASVANRLAKTLSGRVRSRAYRVKHDALIALARQFPECVNVRRDPRLPQFVIVGSAASRFALHAPAAHFSYRRELCAA